jgi:hypothetical protein
LEARGGEVNERRRSSERAIEGAREVRALC